MVSIILALQSCDLSITWFKFFISAKCHHETLEMVEWLGMLQIYIYLYVGGWLFENKKLFLEIFSKYNS